MGLIRDASPRRISCLSSAFRALRPFLPPLNFITIHYTYFIVVPLIASVVFWGSSNPSFSISYVDSLFLVISAMTEAGLNVSSFFVLGFFSLYFSYHRLEKRIAALAATILVQDHMA